MLPLAAALTDKPALLDAISYQAVGLIVVFSALGSIWGLMELMGWIFRAAERRAVARIPDLAMAEPPAPLVEPTTCSVSPQVLAVITAAAHDCLQAGEHIVAIHPLGHAHSTDVQLGAWSSEGRRNIFATRKVR